MWLSSGDYILTSSRPIARVAWDLSSLPVTDWARFGWILCQSALVQEHFVLSEVDDLCRVLLCNMGQCWWLSSASSLWTEMKRDEDRTLTKIPSIFMGKVLDHKIARTFWSANPFWELTVLVEEGDLKIGLSLHLWRNSGFRLWNLYGAECGCNKSPSWRPLWQSLGSMKTGRGILYCVQGSGTSVLEAWQGCCLLSHAGSLEEHVGVVTDPKKLSCHAGSEIFCLWPLQVKLQCKCTLLLELLLFRWILQVIFLLSSFFFCANFHCFSPVF